MNMNFNLELFMNLHQQFMSEEDPFTNESLCANLHDLLVELDDPREIKNPLHKDGLTYGYVAVAHAHIFNKDDDYVGQVCAGDVMILQFNWDRNIIVTNLPLSQNCPILCMLRDTHIMTGYKGIWLPIFDSSRIRSFAERQIKEYTKSVSQLFDEEEKSWEIQIPKS
jgi:hypothetical protein